MFHAREDWAVAAALPPRQSASFGRKAEPFSLVVDLGTDLFTQRWWQGAATLALLCGAALVLGPGIAPLPGGVAEPLADRELAQAEALAIAPLSRGGDTGLRMAPAASVEPLIHAPERSSVDLFLTLGPNDDVARLLARAGASYGDAVRAASLIHSAAPRLSPGTAVALILGARAAGGRPVEKVTLRGGLGLTLVVERGPDGLRLAARSVPVDATPLRIRGRVGDGFYWSLRTAGVSPEAAADYLRAIGSRIDVGEVAGNDRFDLIIANRRAATGESQAGALLYASLDRAEGEDVALLRWTAAGRTDWFDAGGAGVGLSQGSGMAWPTGGRITSGFGMRVHPILRFARMHRGIDFAPGRGAPIVAAADGVVSAAGWAGGYGRQVRIAHRGGIATSYSHMMQIVAQQGTMVHRGQLIGYVGSSGLSTGPHLHYEVYRGGVAVNPLSVRFVSAPAVDAAQQSAFKARLKALLSVGVKKG